VIRDYVETILVCVIFVLFTRAFVFQQSKIPSGSMENTLLVGDYIMVNRFVYAPTQWDWEKRWIPVRDISRGDVVVFKFPNTPEIDYIKRVIGLPGDRIEIRDGEVWRNDERLEEPYVDAGHRFPREYRAVEVVRPGHLWVMGDHRNASSDSRVWGQLPIELVKGRALLIWWSYPDERENALRPGSDQLAALVRKIVTFPWRSRWSRCFELIR
jgi:signal peptidase I